MAKQGTHRRFDRTARLVGDRGVATLATRIATVFGVGGVGSFAAEGLARAGVGHIILVDFDRVCVTNVNRQVHAFKGTFGKPKVRVMAERLRLINPDAKIEARQAFYDRGNSAQLLTPEPDVVIDAIDNVTAKLHLIATCVRERIPIITSTGAAARLDPTQVTIADLGDTRGDPLARELRQLLRKKYDLGTNGHFGVTAIYSQEKPMQFHQLAYDIEGFRCVCPTGTSGRHDCDKRAEVLGSSPFVPAAFGMAAASAAVQMWLAQ